MLEQPFSQQLLSKELDDIRDVCLSSSWICVGAYSVKEKNNFILCAISNA